MAYSKDTRDKVRQLYVEGLPLKSASVTCGVSYDTARDWKAASEAAGDNWDTARTAHRIGDQGIEELNRNLVEDFARNMIVTTRELENSKNIPASAKADALAQLADAYSKFSKAFARINPKYSGLSVALDTMKTFTDHLRLKDPAALRVLQPHIEDVGAILGKRYGG